MESWTEELENKINLLNYSSRMTVINNEPTCLALTATHVGDWRRVQSDATQLNSTGRRVELSCVAINGA